MAETIELFL